MVALALCPRTEAVICAVPAAMAVTIALERSEAPTVATAGLSLVHCASSVTSDDPTMGSTRVAHISTKSPMAAVEPTGLTATWSGSDGGESQMAPLQVVPEQHRIPHPPQFRSSRLGCTHAPLQQMPSTPCPQGAPSERPAQEAVMQAPTLGLLSGRMHTRPAPQLIPLPRHPGEQSSVHAPFEQFPFGHTWPHPPQLFTSFMKSMLSQVEPQHVPVDASGILHTLP